MPLRNVLYRSSDGAINEPSIDQQINRNAINAFMHAPSCPI